MLIARAILEGRLKYTPELVSNLYACPTCGSCEARCDIVAKLELTKIFEAMRADAVKAEVAPLAKQKAFGMHIDKEHNPYFESHNDRLAWLPTSVKLPETAETVYFAGCTTSYREKRIAIATLEVLQKLGLNFTIMKDEWCCGSPALRTGQLETPWISMKKIVQHNIHEVEKAKAKKIVTSCAGCYRTWKKDYAEDNKDVLERKDGDKLEVLHITELLEQLIKNGELRFEKEVKMRITYHDPCHLGRHVGVYDAPRNVLKAIPGIELIEMKRTREDAWCCGAGGGFKSGYADWAVETAVQRVKEAEELGVEAIVSACSFCWRNLSDAIKKCGSKLKMYDVVELVNQALEPKRKATNNAKAFRH
jgi:heterodisulfide reductase subunit D